MEIIRQETMVGDHSTRRQKHFECIMSDDKGIRELSSGESTPRFSIWQQPWVSHGKERLNLGKSAAEKDLGSQWVSSHAVEKAGGRGGLMPVL